MNENVNLSLTLKNIGPFNELSMKIKPITIITGESTTGKTYLLKLIHTLLSSLNEIQVKVTKYEYGIEKIEGEFNSTFTSLTHQINLEVLKQGTSEGYIDLSIHLPEKIYKLPLRVLKDGVMIADEGAIHWVMQLKYPLITPLLIPEDRIFLTKYLLPGSIELLSKSIKEIIKTLHDIDRTYSVAVTIPESLRALAKSIPYYIVELINYNIQTISNPILLNQALDLCNKTIEQYGKIEISTNLNLTFTNTLGHQININTAPEAIAATTASIIPLPSLLKQKTKLKLISIDHIETNLTPPLTEALIHNLIKYITENNNTTLILTVHNLDTLVSIDATIRELIPENVEKYIAAYELKRQKENITCRKLEITNKHGIEIPDYLDEYLTYLGNKQAELLKI